MLKLLNEEKHVNAAFKQYKFISISSSNTNLIRSILSRFAL